MKNNLKFLILTFFIGFINQANGNNTDELSIVDYFDLSNKLREKYYEVIVDIEHEKSLAAVAKRLKSLVQKWKAEEFNPVKTNYSTTSTGDSSKDGFWTRIGQNIGKLYNKKRQEEINHFNRYNGILADSKDIFSIPGIYLSYDQNLQIIDNIIDTIHKKIEELESKIEELKQSKKRLKKVMPDSLKIEEDETKTEYEKNAKQSHQKIKQLSDSELLKKFGF